MKNNKDVKKMCFYKNTDSTKYKFPSHAYNIFRIMTIITTESKYIF